MKEGFTIIEKIKLPSDFNALVDVENLVDRVCSGLGVQEDAYGNVLVAVTEAVNNAIQHGNEMKKELSVDVAFTAPDTSVGGPVFSYTAVSNPGSVTVTGNASPINVPGLTGGTSYTFTVRGNNPSGSTAYSSASNAATPTNIGFSFLVLAGGGGGGGASTIGAGGAGGGYRSSWANETSGGGAAAESRFFPTMSTNYTVTVGAGGAFKYRGSNSVLGSITSIGGGRGGDDGPNNNNTEAPDGGYGGGSAGGSGGGNGSGANARARGGLGTTGQGYQGGYNTTGGRDGGGGGGAAAAGTNSSGDNGNAWGSGGDGRASSITGTSITRAGGSGGAGNGGGWGGQRGAGSGGVNLGGGGIPSYSNGGSGSADSGVVIVRYPNTFTLCGCSGLSYTTTTSGSNKITIFTSGTGSVNWS
jgi:hypothetical protein